MLPCTTGARPGKINMMSLPYCASSRLLPDRKPSPNPTSSSKDPTPHAMPNMVRNERSLCAQRVRKICAKMSRTVRISYRYYYALLDGFVPVSLARAGRITRILPQAWLGFTAPPNIASRLQVPVQRGEPGETGTRTRVRPVARPKVAWNQMTRRVTEVSGTAYKSLLINLLAIYP